MFALLSSAWGTSFLFIKLGIEDYSPLMLGWLRLSIAALSIWAVVALQRLRPRRSFRLIGALLLVGLVNNALPFTLIPWGEQYIDSGLAAILNSSMPLFTIVIAHFVLADERITLHRLMGLMLGFAGVIVLMAPEVVQSGGDVFSSNSLRGQLAVVGAALCYSLATTFIRRYLRDENPIILTAGQTTAASLWLALPVLLTEHPLNLFQVSFSSAFAVLWLGLVSTACAYLLYFNLIARIGATQISLVTYITPGVGVILGAVFLHERITWIMLGAMVMILGGVIIVNGLPGFVRVGAKTPEVCRSCPPKLGAGNPSGQ
jgi:drug/metabolite transporter (DMT)-like permease